MFKKAQVSTKGKKKRVLMLTLLLTSRDMRRVKVGWREKHPWDM